ncbi:MAG: urease accessory protein UreD [Ilumatobacter sp.]|uniref:urease accessory protein UreD n=1 Tax=Ilumatobacter sp. TaxID=1967498 RepID=UPI003C73C9A5
MNSHGSIVVGHDPVRGAYLRSARCEPPFDVRRCDDRILIAASAAAPVGGDALSLDIDIEPATRARIGTVASTIVLPGPTGEPSTMVTRCSVADGAHLDWFAEPTVSVAGSDHTVTTTIDLAASATCRIVEEVALGRTDERSGGLRLVLRVERDGRVLVHHDESFGPDVDGAGSVVSVGGARHVLSAVLVGVEAGDSRATTDGDVRAAWLPMADDVAVLLAVGPDRPSVLSRVSELAPALAR